MNLAELIRSTKGDRSYEQLARDCGGKPTSQRLQQIATTQLKAFPDGETILNLSRGLAVPARTVVLAAAASLGLPVGGSTQLADLLPPAAAHLTDRQVAAVRAVINAMNDPLERSGGDGTDTTPIGADPDSDPSSTPAESGDDAAGSGGGRDVPLFGPSDSDATEAGIPLVRPRRRKQPRKDRQSSPGKPHGTS